MVFIYIIISLLALKFYHDGKSALFLLSLQLLINNCFGFASPKGVPIKSFDFLISLVIVVTCAEFIKNKHYFRLKYDDLGKSVLLLFVYFLIEYIRTLFFSIDTMSWATKVFRPSLIILFYFYLRRLPYNVYEKFFKYIFVLSCIQGIFFYLQLVGLTGILSGYVSDEGTITRYGNYPSYATLFLFVSLLNDKLSIIKKILLCAFWGMMPVIGMMRGSIMTFCLMLMLFLFVKRKRKYMLYLFIGYVVYVIIISPMFAIRDANTKTSTASDILLVISGKDLTDMDNEGGTFSFRIAMLQERWFYMLKRTETIPFGVGCIHEESPNNRFRFKIGTVNEAYDIGRCTIESGDIVWVPFLLRYGVGLVFVFLILYWRWFKHLLTILKVENNIVIVYFSLCCVSSFIGSFNGGSYSNAGGLFSLILNLGLISPVFIRYNMQQKKKCINEDFSCNSNI